MHNITFASPEVLWSLPLIPLMFLFYYRKSKRAQALGFVVSFADKIQVSNRTFNPACLLLLLRFIATTALLLALARPVKSEQGLHYLPRRQVAIVLAVDVSNSMLAEDLKPNRLDALKKIATAFIDRRSHDKIGLIAYAGESYTVCPLTEDHQLLKALLREAGPEFLEDGTAIGSGLLAAINRLKNSATAGKVVILLTDGENNAGEVPPLKAAAIARKYGIKVYTVGIGTDGVADYPVRGSGGEKEYIQVAVSLDEDLLRAVASHTHGRYFRARSNQDLELIYQEISQAEQEQPQVSTYRLQRELYMPPALVAMALLLAEGFCRYIFFRKFV